MGKLTAKVDPDSSDDEEQVENFQTYVVLEFSEKCPLATIDWVISKITASRESGGAKLLARTAMSRKDKEVVVHISATTERLLDAAELMELKKPYQDGTLRPISLPDLQYYQDSEDRDNMLSMAEKQRIIKRELENIRAMSSDNSVPEYPKVKLYKGEPIIPACIKAHIIVKMFPLHDREQLKRLASDWYKAFFSPQPIERIREYFGEAVAMYFAFLGFYTMSLVPPTVVGIMSNIFTTVDDVSLRVFFCIFNLVWVTLFLEAWKRKSSSLAYMWGSLDEHKFEEARATYYGELDTNKVTGRLEPKYPKWKRALQFYLVSFPVVILCVILAFIMMVVYFQFQHAVDSYNAESQTTFSFYMTFVPTIIYSVIILVVNVYYRKLAKRLNDWENHRLQSAYDNHLIIKLVLFESINSFGALFYVAFYLQDMVMLRRDLCTLLIVQQTFNQLFEIAIPYTMYKLKKRSITKRQRASVEESSRQLQRALSKEPIDKEYRDLAELESTKEPFDEINGTLQDYLEMYLQFGYVFLFSAVFPSAAFWALFNNVTEIRGDAFKLCRIFQRPFPQLAAGIGEAWIVAFEVMNIMAVISNTVIIGVSQKGEEMRGLYGDVNFLLALVAVEHLVIIVKVMLAYLIPDRPEWVQTAVDRVDYQSRQAWTKQKLAEAKERHASRKHSRQSLR